MSAEPTTPSAAKTILVIDDNEVILKTISLKLQGAGYRVITALNGAEGVSAAGKENPDLILLDISFPMDIDGVPWDGFRIMEWLRRLDTAKDIPIIIITGVKDEQNKKRAAAYGAVAFFSKPIDHDNLLKVIRENLRQAAA